MKSSTNEIRTEENGVSKIANCKPKIQERLCESDMEISTRMSIKT
jgi:hypothetical protein